MEKKKVLFPMGILIGAFGHPLFTHYAVNLAIGCKLKSPGIPITLVTDGAAMNMIEPEDKELFDLIIIAKPEWTSGVHGMDFMKFKLHLFEISPYQKTLFLDVDMQWCPNGSPDSLLEKLDGSTFECANRGYKITNGSEFSKYDWFHLQQGYDHYKVEELLDISSEVIYFEKNEVSKKIFSESLRVYKENKISPINYSHGKPDEPYLMMGLALSGHKIEKVNYEPSFWQGRYFRDLKREEYVYKYDLMSVGGDSLAPNTKRIYNNLTGMYFEQSGIKRPPYQAQPKSKLKERQKTLIRK